MNGQKNLNDKAKAFVLNQLDWINEQFEKNKSSPYWNLVECLIVQLKAMYQGYKDKVEKNKKYEESLDFFSFYYLTNMGDLEDIIPAFENQEKNNELHECSGFIKLTKDDLFVSHNTHNM